MKTVVFIVGLFLCFFISTPSSFSQSSNVQIDPKDAPYIAAIGDETIVLYDGGQLFFAQYEKFYKGTLWRFASPKPTIADKTPKTLSLFTSANFLKTANTVSATENSADIYFSSLEAGETAIDPKSGLPYIINYNSQIIKYEVASGNRVVIKSFKFDPNDIGISSIVRGLKLINDTLYYRLDFGSGALTQVKIYAYNIKNAQEVVYVTAPNGPGFGQSFDISSEDGVVFTANGQFSAQTDFYRIEPASATNPQKTFLLGSLNQAMNGLAVGPNNILYVLSTDTNSRVTKIFDIQNSSRVLYSFTSPVGEIFPATAQGLAIRGQEVLFAKTKMTESFINGDEKPIVVIFRENTVLVKNIDSGELRTVNSCVSSTPDQPSCPNISALTFEDNGQAAWAEYPSDIFDVNYTIRSESGISYTFTAGAATTAIAIASAVQNCEVDVDLYLQNDPDSSWRGLLYDGTSNAISTHGCSLTSFAMLANFYAGNTNIYNPSKLNEDFNSYTDALGKTYKAYTSDGGLLWNSAALIASKKYQLPVAFDKAVATTALNYGSLLKEIKDQFCQGNPVILQVNSLSSPNDPKKSHFVVAYGVTTFQGQETFKILDPARGDKTLAEIGEYQNTFKGVRFFKTSTPAPAPIAPLRAVASFISIASESAQGSVEISTSGVNNHLLITTPSNLKVGALDDLNQFFEIDNSSYVSDDISDLDLSDGDQSIPPYRYLFAKFSESGTYKIEMSAVEAGRSSFKAYFRNSNDDLVGLVNFVGVFSANQNISFNVDFDPDATSFSETNFKLLELKAKDGMLIDRKNKPDPIFLHFDLRGVVESLNEEEKMLFKNEGKIFFKFGDKEVVAERFKKSYLFKGEKGSVLQQASLSQNGNLVIEGIFDLEALEKEITIPISIQIKGYIWSHEFKFIKKGRSYVLVKKHAHRHGFPCETKHHSFGRGL